MIEPSGDAACMDTVIESPNLEIALNRSPTMERSIKPEDLRSALGTAVVLDRLRAAGVKARYIEGGIEGWKAAGGEVVGK